MDLRAFAPDGHTPPERPAISLLSGQGVEVGERDTEWPAFVFVTATTGQGWVPSRHLSADSGAATVLHPYDTTELALEPGSHVMVLIRDDESGWWWCRRADGATGWVPVRSLNPLV